MKHIERTITVDKPAERVWEYLSDFRSTNDWDPGTVLTERTSGDGGAGTTYRNTSKFLGRESELEYTVTEVAPKSNRRRASTSGGRSPPSFTSSMDAYRSMAMPVRERFRSKMRTLGDAPGRTVTVMN